MGPPRVLRLSEVSAYMLTTYKVRVSRMTVYNWTTKGRGLDSLQWKTVKNPIRHHKDAQVKVTTEKWVDDFIARTGLEGMRRAE